MKNLLKHPYSRILGSSAAVIGGTVVSAVTSDPQYAQAGAGLAAAGHAADFFKSLGRGVLGSDLYRAFTEDSPADRDLLANHDLRRLVGTAIAECVKTAENGADKGDQKSLKKLAGIIPDGWQVIADHPMLTETTAPISETQLVGLFTYDVSGDEPEDPVLAASEWTTILKAIAKLKLPKYKFTDSAFDRASRKLEDRFLPMLVEAAKNGFANQGEAYAALHLRMLSEILNGQKKIATTESLADELKTQLGTQMVAFAGIAQSHCDRIERQIDAKSDQIHGQVREQYNGLIQSLEKTCVAVLDLGKRLSKIENIVTDTRDMLVEVHDGVQQLVADAKSEQGPITNDVMVSPPFLLPKSAIGTFYGRVKERNALIRRLTERQDTFVVGQAGYGKTALAAYAVTQVVGNTKEMLPSSPFPGGVVYLDLYTSQSDLAGLFGQLADALVGFDSGANDDARQRAIKACRGRQILVIIEGAEIADGENGRPHLQDLLTVLAPENCRLILTRDRKQAAGTSCVSLENKLNQSDSLNLFNALTGKRVVGDARSRILDLLDGHPLAITWAGGLLSLEDEDASVLVDEWKTDPTRTLNDPENAKHTLKWLFGRSVRGLDELTKAILFAAGLLANEAFSVTAIEAAFADETRQAIRQSIRRLINQGLLRRSKVDGHREFGHVLAHQFARDESDERDLVLRRLAKWLYENIQGAMVDGQAVPKEDLQRHLGHTSALLQADDNQTLWAPLGNYLLYDGCDRLIQVGRLEWVRLSLAAVSHWLQSKSKKDSDLFWQREHSVSLNRLGDLAVAEGNLREARALFRDGLVIRKRLAESDTGNAKWQRDLSVSFNMLGDVAIAEGNLTEARTLFRDCLAIRKRLAESDPDNAGWQRDLSISSEKLGNVAVAEGNLTEARSLFRDCLVIHKRLAELDPGNAGWQRDLSVSFNMLGDVAVAEGNLTEARSLFRDCLVIRKRLAESDPGNARWQRDMSVSFNKLGDVANAEGNLTEARTLFRDCLVIRKRLAESDRGNAGWQRDLSVSFNKLGESAIAEGNLTEARVLFREGLVLAQYLANSGPGNAGWQRDLAVSHFKIAKLEEKSGNGDAANSSYLACLSVLERMKQNEMHFAPQLAAGYQALLDRFGDDNEE